MDYTFLTNNIFQFQKRGGKLDYRRVAEEITSTYDEFGMRCERDAFDALLDHAPDKLQVVKKVIYNLDFEFSIYL